jgi:hypothetical protein
MSQTNIITKRRGKRAVPTGILGQPITRIEQFAQRFKVLDNGCWEWQGKRSKGYGRFSVAGRDRSAHRIMWELVGRPVDFDKELDHLCRNPPCINPAHLEQVTALENAIRKNRNPLCRRGHVWADNEVPYNVGGGKIRRRCNACNTIRARNFHQRIRLYSSTITSVPTERE